MIYAVIIIITLAVFIGIYYLVHHSMGFTSLGRIAATVIPAIMTGLGLAVDQLNTLPWDKLLDAGKVVAVTTGLLIGHIVVQIYTVVKAQLSPPPTTPAA